MVHIAPSILSADFGALNKEISTIEAHSDYMHIDVMDGHFVPNLTFGAPVVRCIQTDTPLDVHLMVENPQHYVDDFASIGLEVLTFHYEAVEYAPSLLKRIRKQGMKAGISVKPNTDITVLKPLLEHLDWVLVMSVEPGFGGQSFMPAALDKIKWLREKAPDLDIAVDGGINAETGTLCKEAGANILIAGSYIFKADDRLAAIRSLRG
ncbi:ribulose-phosphate 3-epimerase [Candidatus Peregrinibacteria bacterium]|nr:ribulose-phosphate 3-epimerase [Candidatus Peregrinibacteria bacterium]